MSTIKLEEFIKVAAGRRLEDTQRSNLDSPPTVAFVGTAVLAAVVAVDGISIMAALPVDDGNLSCK